MNNNSTRPSKILYGLAASCGLANGTVVVVSNTQKQVIPTHRIAITEVASELEKLEQALSQTRKQMLEAIADLTTRIEGNETAILESHLMILEDPLLTQECRKKIQDELLNAAAAVKEVSDSYLSIFDAMSDSCLKERARDVEDVANNILKNLAEHRDTAIHFSISEPCILVADELSPSETIALPPDLILGVATNRGSTTSHAALLARALGIPAVVGLGNLTTHVRTGDAMILDGKRGKVLINPSASELEEFQNTRSPHKCFGDDQERNLSPGQTLDLHPVPFLANVDSSTKLTKLADIGIEGIGLYRTEYLWLKHGFEPSEEEQTAQYRLLAQALQPDQVATIRIFDLGGDKATRCVEEQIKENNPFLGNRSIRMLLQERAVLKRQLRAILRASDKQNLRIMYPMITTIEELRMVNQELTECMQELRDEGITFDPKIPRGVMIETPAAALIATALAQECNFFSIGTNDLVQYTLAVDRCNAAVAQLYQPTHPAVLQLIKMTVQAGRQYGINTAVCGESAADPTLAMLFIGLGVNELSMSPNLIAPVRQLVARIRYTDAQQLADEVLAMQTKAADEIYTFCQERIEQLLPAYVKI